ncbi:hypothetical protein [Alkalibacter mobilis]|nr:hypothetical protein [Alkalibacter mobilis]
MEQNKKVSETLEELKQGYFKEVPEEDADMLIRKMINTLLTR